MGYNLHDQGVLLFLMALRTLGDPHFQRHAFYLTVCSGNEWKLKYQYITWNKTKPTALNWSMKHSHKINHLGSCSVTIITLSIPGCSITYSYSYSCQKKWPK